MSKKLMNTLLIRLVEDNFKVDGVDKQELKAQLNKSIEDEKEPTTKIGKRLDSFFKHPYGVLLLVLGFAWVDRAVKRMTFDSAKIDSEEAFALAYEEGLRNKMLEKLNNRS